MGQEKGLESGEVLLTPTKSPYLIPNNLEVIDKDALGAELTREYISKLCSTEDHLGWGDKEILVWNHRLNHCYLKSLLRINKRGIITNNFIRARKSPLLLPASLVSPTRDHRVPKAKYQTG